jgi:hypothetical protein
MNTYLTRGEEGAGGTAAQQHRGTAAQICARPHLQHLSRLLTRSQATETLARDSMVDESPWHRGELDWAEANGVKGDEQRWGRRFLAVRRKHTRRRFLCPTRRWRPPELIGIARRHRRRRAVTRARGGRIRVRVSSGKWERVKPDWTGLVWPNPLGWVWPEGPGSQIFF